MFYGKPQFFGVRAAAANLGSSRGNYTVEDFRSDYPQFFNAEGYFLGSLTMLEQIIDMANTAVQPFYALLNANVRLIGEKYSLDFWTKNLTGTQYNTFYFVSIEHEFLQRGKPLQIGATLRINI